MKNENGVTMVTVVVIVIVIGVIAVTSILSSRSILDESKEEAKLQSQAAVETAVSKYSAKAATGGVLSPANIRFPGQKNPVLERIEILENGDKIVTNENAGENWYLLLQSDLEEMGVSYAEENYLVNYKENIVIPLSSTDNVFEKIKFYEKNQ